MIEVDIKDIVDSSVVNVYIAQSIAEVESLPIYKDNSAAIFNSAEQGSVYFNWTGNLIKLSIGNIVLNLSKAMSYLRRIF